MILQDIIKAYSEHKHSKSIAAIVESDAYSHVFLKGLFASAASCFASSVVRNTSGSHVFILSDKEKSAYFQNDLKELLPEKDILFFPATYNRSVIKSDRFKTDDAGLIMRTEVLNHVGDCSDYIVVSYPEALYEKVTDKESLKKNTLDLKTGDQIQLDFIRDVLIEYGFERVDFVYEPGQFAMRGSIVDIFSFSNELPYRLDFFDEEIETIRTFDTVTQLSVANHKKISVVPDLQTHSSDSRKISFFEFIDKQTKIWTDNFNVFFDPLMDKESENTIESSLNFSEAKALVKQFTTIEFSGKSYYKDNTSFEFNISGHVQLNKNFELLANQFVELSNNGYTNYVVSNNEKQFDRLREIMSSEEVMTTLKEDDGAKLPSSFSIVRGIFHEGFTDHDLMLACFTEHQIYGRYHKYVLRGEAYHKNKETITLREINTLQSGDYVVHIDHGIGRFGGMQTLNNNGVIQEAIRLVYQDNDILLVNIHNLHKISKYKGKEGTQPRIYKLGSSAWDTMKKSTKSKVKDIARGLIALYAKRKQEKGFAFSHDSYLQYALESSFIFEDTPDQIKATEAVKKDMESDIPMDRLICGDVGFGKTEVAVRAAFKAVTDGKQVAVLVPTTVLTLQHFKTFAARLKELPCKVDFISRLKSTAQQQITLVKLEKGEIDIIIGTHRLVSKDVKFKDLGLMIIDEEQKFGVAVKEKLKALKINVDTLTLTATPIPRTLQFSLMGARDLSVINTAPPNRYPIHTELHQFDKEMIKNAIDYEYRRNGQVFFIHNRIDNIFEIESLINKLVPHAATAVIHGRMKPKELEDVMSGFINEDFVVLIATGIVESGLDIPNANTIIINNAQNFGLSDLHQLRGRVGRSDKKAFCYLISPPETSLTGEARQRLRAIETFSELGSGFNIAMQDLDIRGAGNLLGGEQSGFISDIGYETYHKILDEAMIELREEEFKELFKENLEADPHIPDKDFVYVTDCHLDTDLELRFKENYIENSEERLRLYRTLDAVADEEGLLCFENDLKDRFGTMPVQTIELLNAVRLRRKAMTLGMEKILLRNGKMTCYLVSDQDSAFYRSGTFTAIIEFLKKYPKKTSLKEYKDKLTMSFQDIKSIKDALAMLGMIEATIH